MSWNWIITKIDDEGEMLSAFGQLIFTNAQNYVGGGDPNGTVNLDKGSAGVAGVSQNTAGLPVFLSGQTALRATRPAFEINVQIESGYNAVIVPGSGPLNFKIKILDPATKAELGAGAYPAALISAVFNYLLLKFKRNI